MPGGVDRGAPAGAKGGGPIALDEMKHRYRVVQEQMRRLEAERAAAIGRGDPVSGRVRLGLAEARISAEELRMWGNRELTRLIRERAH